MGLEIKQSYQRILFELECNGRSKFTDIGDRTGISQQTVSYAVKSMRENDVIKGFYPLFDYTKFGYNGYIALFRVNAFSRNKIEELKQMFGQHSMVAWINRLSGSWDFMVFFLSPNASQFNKEFKDLVAEYPDQLSNYKILSSVVIHDIGRNYLADDDEKAGDVIVGGDRELVDVKDSWKDICEVLWENPRASSVDVAEKLDITPKTVIDRMKKLEEENLVKGYRPKIGIQELGARTYLLFVKYNNRDVEQENELRDYCLDHPNVTMMVKTFGDYDAIIRIEMAQDRNQREVIRSIRERYGDILLDYNILEVVEDIDKRYLPYSFFEGEEFPDE